MQVNPEDGPPEIYVTWSDPRMTNFENCIVVALLMIPIHPTSDLWVMQQDLRLWESIYFWPLHSTPVRFGLWSFMAIIAKYGYNSQKWLYFVARNAYDFIDTSLLHKTASYHLRSKLDLVSKL